MTPDVGELLRGVRAAGRVEQLDRGLTRQQRQQLARTVDHRVLEAVVAGATVDQVAEALHVGRSRAQERIRRARLDATTYPTQHAGGRDGAGVVDGPAVHAPGATAVAGVAVVQQGPGSRRQPRLRASPR